MTEVKWKLLVVGYIAFLVGWGILIGFKSPQIQPVRSAWVESIKVNILGFPDLRDKR